MKPFKKIVGSKRKGFTLVELLIYIAILGGVLVLATGFFWNIALGYIKENSYQELQQNGRFSMFKMTQEIKKAKSIMSPSLGREGYFLSLQMDDPLKSPTNFKIEEGILIMEQGGNSFELTSDRVIVDSLSFTNLSYEEERGTLRIEMDFSHLNPEQIQEYDANINLSTSVSLPGSKD